jgi:5-formaminoimidazole-4-carboxamide-1-beta-D-ribofuranosyl 5'-monophosphate synthetase
MVEGDYGLKLPVTVSGTTLASSDSLRFTFKAGRNGDTILTKEYENIVDNTIQFELSESESALFPVGSYVFSLDWYQDGNFMCNIIPCANLRVVDKA